VREKAPDGRIAIFSPPLVIGGAEHGVVNLANGFICNGNAVDLILTRAQGVLLDSVDSRVRIVDLECEGVIRSLLPLAGYLKANSPEFLISAQTHASLIAMGARTLARVTTKNILVEVTTMSLNYGLEPGFRNKLIPIFARLFYRFSDAIVCLTDGIEDDLRKTARLNDKTIYRIYNPVLPDDIFEKIGQTIEHPWFTPDSPPVLVTLGRLTAAKDYPNLLRAFALASRERKLRLLVLGDGTERARLEALAKSLEINHTVQFLGFVENPYPYLDQSDVFVLSSAWEGLSHVLIEAMACGLSIVSTDCRSGPAEVLENGKFGILVPVGDSTALAKGILEALQTTPDRESLQRRALDFTTNASIIGYLTLFEDLRRDQT